MAINTIPKITDPMGKCWDQPSLQNIIIDDTHALMSNDDLNRLSEYSSSIPSGVYPGKMWRAKWRDTWLLRWYGESDVPGMCSNNQREILIV
ncbi:hypothetical protein F6R98_10260 [Candidatus Methylospira mobilis]|uniref:Uncharacterized protein n=1 Tax=Candidatus Methylospira mobilis TaxID=1808979 RepID=A0A5Q0BLH5_9GAMM|nr:hypothetical protein [Candidatus Methylospira mobilis]QFY42947.1 hypothetical protein F6R98_10260 [Candidatus Methylospira mobilis]